MGKKLPELPDTGRHYVEATRGAKLASPGVERFVRPPSRLGTLAKAVLVVAALIGATFALSWLMPH